MEHGSTQTRKKSRLIAIFVYTLVLSFAEIDPISYFRLSRFSFSLFIIVFFVNDDEYVTLSSIIRVYSFALFMSPILASSI